MTTSPPPPPFPGSYADPRATRKPRPSGWWFALGGALIVVGVVLGVVVFVLTIRNFAHVDATVDEGRTTSVALTGGADYLVWNHPGTGDTCTIAGSDGSTVATAGLGSTSYSRTSGSTTWTGDRRFTAPADGKVTVTCPAGGGSIQIGRVPHLGTFAGSAAVSIGLPLVLGLAGVGVLVVTTVAFVRRPARPRRPVGVA